jgi:transposase InsO family protein/transposase-like protein
MFGIREKKKARSPKGPRPGKRGLGKKKRVMKHAGPYTPEQRRQAVEAYLKSGMSQKDFAKTWGTSEGSLYNWVKAYQEQGPKALEGASLKNDAKKRGRKGLPDSVKEVITTAKQENPSFGTRSVRNFLWRFRGVKVSNGTVRKTLRQANIPPVPPQGKKRRTKKKPKVQRFERARAMQLWQTDITSFVLTRHSQRVYLTVFMDDHSRYIVSWSLALQQTKEFVMETLLAGISRFGKPEEVLTDQGRQYFSWRGKSDFRKLLKKQGIEHVVARAHHPETVGKCERFWETVGEEFWSRVEPQELTDARERFEQYVNHYNHFRPHQGIDGLTPADRFFGAAVDVRKAIEDTISKNALRIALGEAPRKPVFLIGQIGETPVSLHGEKGKLVLQTPEGLRKSLDYEDFGHAKKEPTPNENKGEITYDESPEGNDHGAERERGTQGAAQAEPKPEIRAPQTASTSGESALGDGNTGATEDGARGIGCDHGVLARQDYKAGGGSAAQDAAAPGVAALPASALGDGSGALDPAQGQNTAGNEGSGTCGAGNPAGGQSETAPQENRGTGEDDVDARAPHLSSQGDAGLQRCEDPNGDGHGSAVPGSIGCKQGGQESNGSSTGGSSS